MTSKEKRSKKLYGTNSISRLLYRYSKSLKEADSDIKDKDIESAERSDRNYALARYRELVAARREREKLRPREPEIYHYDFFKNN
jgi:hypothetical protein